MGLVVEPRCSTVMASHASRVPAQGMEQTTTNVYPMLLTVFFKEISQNLPRLISVQTNFEYALHLTID